MSLFRPAGVIAACVIAVAAQTAPARSYPDKSISIIIPLGAGGTMDRFTRTVAEDLSRRLGQTVMVENRPGGGMVIGASAVASAPPDGYTLMNAPSGAYVINPTLYKKLPYDPMKDFVPVALYAYLPFVLVVHPSLPVRTVKELIQYARDNPEKVSYAASTRGAIIHLAGEMLMQEAGIKLISVPYKQGGPAALNDVVAGHVPVTFADPSLLPGLIAGGKLRALGVSSKTRMASLPDVPTLDEAGVPGFEAMSWHMIVAPAKTPSTVVEMLNAEIRAVTSRPLIREQMLKLGLLPVTSPAVAELRKFLASESKKWGDIVRRAGVAGTL